MKLQHRTNKAGTMLVIDELPVDGDISAVRVNGKWFGPAAEKGWVEDTVSEGSTYERKWEESAPTMDAHNNPKLLE